MLLAVLGSLGRNRLNAPLQIKTGGNSGRQDAARRCGTQGLRLRWARVAPCGRGAPDA